MIIAVTRGYLDVVEYLHTHGCPWPRGIGVYAIKHARLEVLQYAHQNGCPWNSANLKSVAQSRYATQSTEARLAIIQYLDDHP